ncbi:hypothetical protein [Shewanella sp.]|uniref:hypothetical protein n=1 Tax=Shewanella sp. TaxID=50422 RepID=UPI002589DB2C|nr:hypothetical protein [Shewanella sp.]MCJ8305159.1 hypothetical protein [Shewanella sp.]
MANASQAIETFPKFDLSNPVHLDMRKVMTDLHWNHTSALQRGVLTTAIRYRGRAEGLERVSRLVLKDNELSWLCFCLVCSFEAMDELYQVRAAA